MERLARRVKKQIIKTVDDVQMKIYTQHRGTQCNDKNITSTIHAQQGSAADFRETANSLSSADKNITRTGQLPQGPTADSPETAIPSSAAGSFAMSGNKDVNITNNTYVGFSNGDAVPTSVGAGPVGRPTGGKFELTDNDGLQACFLSGSVGPSTVSGGDTTIKGNKKAQWCSDTTAGVGNENLGTSSSSNSKPSSEYLSTASPAATSDISQNEHSQIMDVSSQSGASSGITQNKGCQVMRIQKSGYAAPSIDKKDSHLVVSEQSEDGAVAKAIASSESGACTQSTQLEDFGRPKPKSFHKRAISTLKQPHDCSDVAFLKQGSLLIASPTDGLTEYSLNNAKLSHWRPPALRDKSLDEVISVASLNDGRAAVGLGYSKHVIILKKRKENNEDEASWVEDKLLSTLQSPPWRISVNKDELLAVARGRFDSKSNTWTQGEHVEFLRITDGQQLSDLHIGYDVFSLALTTDALITLSNCKIQINGGRRAIVIDARSLSRCYQLNWRYDRINEDEEIQGICADYVGDVVYAAVLKSDLSSGRVLAISQTNGNELLNYALEFPGPQLPMCLSLGSGDANSTESTALAALCRDRKSAQWKTVTVHKEN